MRANAIINPLQGLLALLRRDVATPMPPPEPQHDLANELRAEFHGYIAELRTEAESDRHAALAREADLKLQIEHQVKTIDALKNTDAARLGEIRELYTRIGALERQLVEERNARERAAQSLGDVQAQLRLADDRLKTQRVKLDEQGQQIAVLNDERAKYQGLYSGEALAREMLERDLQTARGRIVELESQVVQLQADVARLSSAQ